jgi:hypothetical protein
MRPHGFILLSCLSFAACLVAVPDECKGGVNCEALGDGGIDAGRGDAGGTDGGRIDAGRTDAGRTDAGSTDAGGTDAGGTDWGGLDFDPCGNDWCFPDAGTLYRCDQAALEACSNSVIAIAVDDTHLAWCSLGADAGYDLWTRTLDGGNPTRLLQSPVSIFSIVLRDGYAYSASYGGITQSPLDGGPPRVLATQPLAFSLAVSSSHAYWSPGTPGGNVYRVPLDGGATELIAAVEGEVFSIAVDDTAVYWAGFSSGLIRRWPFAGGSVSTLFSGQSVPAKVVVRQGSIFWGSSRSPGDIRRGPVTGGAQQVVFAGDTSSHFDVDDRWVYYLGNSPTWTPSLYRVPVAGGAAPQALLNPRASGVVALGGTRLYFSAGAVHSLPVDCTTPGFTCPPATNCVASTGLCQ